MVVAGKSADELELAVFPYRKEASNSYARHSDGSVAANQSSAERLHNYLNNADVKKLYELPLWDLLDDRVQSRKKFEDKNILQRIQETSNPMEYNFLLAVYELRIAEYDNDPYVHFEKMEWALRLCPYYFSTSYFLGHYEKLLYFLYRLSWKFKTTESRIMPDHDLIYFYIENIGKYDYEKSERPVIYLPNFMDSLTEETFYKLIRDKSFYKFV